MKEIIGEILKEFKDNKKLRESGSYIGLPMPFPRMKKKFPFVTRGRYAIITAGSKIGKTQIADFIFLYWVFIFQKEMKTNIKFKITYFSLEMSKADKIKAAWSFLLYYYKGVKASPDKLSSQYDDYILKDDLLKNIEDAVPLLEEFLEMVEVIDNIRNPYGIYKYCKDKAELEGKYTYKTINWVDNQTKEVVKKKVIDKYIPNDPDIFNIVITDHISLLAPEKGETLHQAMSKFSSSMCLKLRDRFKYLIVNIQQQAQAQEGVENMKLNMLKPSHNGLADNKLTGRDVDLMFGLFAPNRFNIKNHDGYDITRMKDNYREFITILNRRGSSISTDLYFDGEVNFFKELPASENMNDDIYKSIKNKDIKIKLT